MRLDKFIANNTIYSRSEIKKLVKAGRITVNGDKADDVSLKIKSKTDCVTLDGSEISAIGKVYLMLNKPAGYVCANEDGEHPTVIDLLREEKNYKGKSPLILPYKDLQIAGRLDLDTTGLVLITNDGKWNHTITSPAIDCKKTYRVTLKDSLNPKVPELFAKGLYLEGEKKKTRPAFLHVITSSKVRLSLSEGKYHQVKRMFAATGNHVKKLHRETIAGLMLDKTLEPAQFRYLTADELEAIQRTIGSASRDE